MDKLNTAPLTDLCAKLVADIVRSQHQLDAQYEKDLLLFEKLIHQTPETHQAYLLPLAPKRQLMKQTEIHTRVQLQQQHSKESSIGIGVQMMNFSADMRFQRDTNQDAWIRIEIEQAPMPI